MRKILLNLAVVGIFSSLVGCVSNDTNTSAIGNSTSGSNSTLGSTVDAIVNTVPSLITGTQGNRITETETVTFLDTDAFDSDVANRMNDGFGTLEVHLLKSFSINQIPPRLGSWLKAITDNGGKMGVKADAKVSAKFFGLDDVLLAAAIPLVKDYVSKRLTYQAASRYNATLYFNPETEQVSRVVFTRKPVNTSSSATTK